jgi:histidinol-phosphate aminotransferase
MDALVQLYRREKPRAVLISSPNNPTGNSISLPDLKSVLGELRDTIVILDQAYAFGGFNDHLEILLNDNPNLILVRTFSKYFALAGLRIGFALVGENIHKLTRSTNRYLGFNRLSEEVAIAALDSPDYYRMISDKMNQDKELYYAELGRLKGFKVFRSDANFVLVKIPTDIIPELKKFLQARGLFVKFMNEERLRTHLRITLGTQEENRAVVRAIQEFSGIQPSV